ncbi:MAG TPA: LptF/LptG family permease [Longimicrobiales bacterium]|nr:LptF/LptG family permease [Longimicrobiales bacterium]
MRILTRYLLRLHAGPFFFSLLLLTGLLFVNTVAKRFEDELAGKGLALDVILEVMALSVPHVVALTLPMAVLVAVLYAFSSLSAENEVTALKASGVNMARLLVPVVVAATLLAAGMVWFNDRVLPETNHRLATLIADIQRKSPTLQLKEQVLNEIRSGEYRGDVFFLKANRIEPGTNRLWDVVIYDLSDPTVRRTIYADSGRMAFNRERTDLFLTLHDGEMVEVESTDPALLRRIGYRTMNRRIPDVGTELERTGQNQYRSDREMGLAMLAQTADERQAELDSVRAVAAEHNRTAVIEALEGPRAGSSRSRAGDARGAPVGAEPGTGQPYVPGADEPAVPDAEAALAARLREDMAGVRGVIPRELRGTFDGESRQDPLVRRTAVQMQQWAGTTRMLSSRVNQYRVEYHKKWAIPFACIVFVLMGAPIGVRFPRGGVGMVISVSLVVFGVYYMGLMGGETLADKGHISPFWAMWTTNVVFLALGAWGVTRIGREAATSRGGGWDDLIHTVKGVVLRPVRALSRRPGAEAA